MVERAAVNRLVVGSSPTSGAKFILILTMDSAIYYVYVLQNPDGRLYIGFTSDLNKRVRQHQEEKGSWTRGRGPWELVQWETFDNRAEAMRRERNLKRGKTNKELRNNLNKAQR